MSFYMSFASEDQARAEEIAAAVIEQTGLPVTMSSPTATKETVKAASVFLACLSTPYIEGKRSNEEFAWCVATQRPFLVLLFGHWSLFPPKGAMGMAMAGRLYIDFSSGVNPVNLPQIKQLSGKLGLGEQYSMATAKLDTKVVKAIENGDLEALKAMHAAQVNLSDDGDAMWRWSPLCWAVYHKQTKVVQWLAEEVMADPNVIEKAGKLPLHVACKNGLLDSVRYLVERGTDVNFIANSPKDSWSPLMYASNHGHVDIADYLIQHGADPNQKDAFGNTAVTLAKSEEMKKALKKPSPPDQHWDVFWSYNWGVQKEAIALVAKLKAAGLTVWQDIEQMSGGDELFMSIDRGMRQSSLVVLNVTEAYAKSPNCIKEAYLCAGLSKPRIPVLCQAGLQYPPPGPMQRLLAPFAPIDLLRDPDQGFALLLAEIKKQLHATNTERQDSKDKEEKQVAKVYSKALEDACTAGDLEKVQSLVAGRADPDARDPTWGWSSISWAIWKGHNHVVQWLCREGRANPNVVDANGKTALHTACKNNNMDASTFLLKRGGLVNLLVDLAGATTWTPLMYAANHGHLELCRYLLQWGADPRLKDRDGKTALDHSKTTEIKAELAAAAQKLNSMKAPESYDMLIVCDEINMQQATLIRANLEKSGAKIWVADYSKKGMDLFIAVDGYMRPCSLVLCILGETPGGSPVLQQMVNLCDGLKKPAVSVRVQPDALFPPPGPMGPILAPSPVCDVLEGEKFSQSIEDLLAQAKPHLEAAIPLQHNRTVAVTPTAVAKLYTNSDHKQAKIAGAIRQLQP
eukprot:g5217.t1